MIALEEFFPQKFLRYLFFPAYAIVTSLNSCPKIRPVQDKNSIFLVISLLLLVCTFFKLLLLNVALGLFHSTDRFQCQLHHECISVYVNVTCHEVKQMSCT